MVDLSTPEGERNGLCRESRCAQAPETQGRKTKGEADVHGTQTHAAVQRRRAGRLLRSGRDLAGFEPQLALGPAHCRQMRAELLNAGLALLVASADRKVDTEYV